MEYFKSIAPVFTTDNIQKTSESALNVQKVVTDIPIDLSYQKNLIDAANQVNIQQRKEASARLYCINKLEWEKTKSNLWYVFLPIVLGLVILIILYNSNKLNVISIILFICIFLFWYLFYTLFYRYRKLIKWNTMLLKINTNTEFFSTISADDSVTELLNKCNVFFNQIL